MDFYIFILCIWQRFLKIKKVEKIKKKTLKNVKKRLLHLCFVQSVQRNWTEISVQLRSVQFCRFAHAFVWGQTTQDVENRLFYFILFNTNTKTVTDTQVEKKTTLTCARKQNSAIQCSNRERKKTPKTYRILTEGLII